MPKFYLILLYFHRRFSIQCYLWMLCSDLYSDLAIRLAILSILKETGSLKEVNIEYFLLQK